MADFFRGLRGGFDVGLEAGTERRKRKMEQELAAQGDEYDTVQGRGLRVTDRNTGEESSVVIDPTAGADMDAIRKQYTDAGYMVDTMDNAYTARSGQGADTGVYTDAAAAQSAARKGNYGLTNKRAGVYEKYGDVEMARGLRRDAQAMKAQDQEMDIRQARDGREQRDFDWLEGERNRVKGLEAAAMAYENGDWAGLSKLATNVWGDQNRYEISPDGKSVAIFSKDTGEPLGEKPMPDRQTFMKALARSRAENWMPLAQLELNEERLATDQEQWMYDHNLRAREAADNREYHQRALGLQRDQARMGSVVETDQGLFVPSMVNGQMRLTPLTANGLPLRKPQKPIDDKVMMEVQAEAAARAQANPAFKRASAGMRQQMIQEETNAILQTLRPQSEQPAAATDDAAAYAAMDKLHGGQPAAQKPAPTLPTYPEMREAEARKRAEEARRRSGQVPGYTQADPYANMW